MCMAWLGTHCVTVCHTNCNCPTSCIRPIAADQTLTLCVYRCGVWDDQHREGKTVASSVAATRGYDDIQRSFDYDEHMFCGTYTHMHTHAPPPPRTQTHTHAHTRTHKLEKLRRPKLKKREPLDVGTPA